MEKAVPEKYFSVLKFTRKYTCLLIQQHYTYNSQRRQRETERERQRERQRERERERQRERDRERDRETEREREREREREYVPFSALSDYGRGSNLRH